MSGNQKKTKMSTVPYDGSLDSIEVPMGVGVKALEGKAWNPIVLQAGLISSNGF